MVTPFQTVSTQELAVASTLDGRRVSVRKVRFNMPVPGLGTEGYAVDVLDGSGAGIQSAGFASQAEAMDYLSSTQSKPYTVIDAMGNRVQETRVGLGIPPGMILDFQQQETPRNAPVVASPVPPNASQFPDAAAAMNAPSDANRRMVVTSEQSFDRGPMPGLQTTPVSDQNQVQPQSQSSQTADSGNYEDAPLS